MDLSFIEQHIAPLYPHFKAAYNSLSASNIPIIGDISSHVRSTAGKQIRPMLTLLSALSCGLHVDTKPDHPLFRIAAAIETLHSSTLIHDDVIDQSDMRRGIPTVNKIWNNKAAVLVGDFYLAQVMRTLNKVDDSRVTDIINQTVIRMCEGELLQLQYTSNFNISDDIYFKIIENKTAVFMAACCATGATMAESSPTVVSAMYDFGLNLGMAFQIRDDILDFQPSSLTGKPQGNDLVEHKCTLPLILTLRNIDPESRKEILDILANETLTDSQVDSVSRHVKKLGFKTAYNILSSYIDKAQQSVKSLPGNTYRSALVELSEKIKETEIN